MIKNQKKVNDGLQNNYQLGRKVLYGCFTYYEVDGEEKLIYSVWGSNRTTKFVHLDHWKPKRDSFWGHRLAIFCLNVQNAKSLISTLRYQKGKAELYPMYIANTRMIQDRTDLDF
jgi:hypothetical protein